MENRKTILKSVLVALIICLIAESIGPLEFQFQKTTVRIMTLIWAILIGILCSPALLGKWIKPFRKVINTPEIKIAPYLLSLTLYPLAIMFGIGAGPKVGVVFHAGPALILQELGNVMTMLIALPLGMILGLRRASVGATFSLCRDTALGIIGDKYGLNSEEGMGTLGTYISGSIFGTLFYSLLAPLALKMGFHPYSLAMASGMGSASMMTAATTALSSVADPKFQQEILAYSATSGLLTAVTGVYIELFVALPLANQYYRVLDRIGWGKRKKGEKNEQ